MKRVLCLVLISSLLLTACGNKNTDNEVTNTVETIEYVDLLGHEVYPIEYQCNEFDLKSNNFTDSIILAINIPNTYTRVDRESLSDKEEKRYIDAYQRITDENKVVSTISIFELKSKKTLSDDYKVSTNWYIDESSYETESTYTRLFYSNIPLNGNEYTVGLAIIDNNKNMLSIEDSLTMLSFITKEDCKLPEQSNSFTVEGTLDKPAELGEWVTTSVYNKVSGQYEPICICINGVYTGQLAQNAVDSYNHVHPNESIWLDNSADECEFTYYEYSIFFPSSFTTDKNVIDIDVPISICNTFDDGMGIKGFNNLERTIVDMSPAITAVSGEIWSEGYGIFEAPIDSVYYIKIKSTNEDTETKYFKSK